jgi:hypothetical protein
VTLQGLFKPLVAYGGGFPFRQDHDVEGLFTGRITLPETLPDYPFATARLSTCRDTAMPNREFSPSPKRARTLKQASEETKGFLKTRLNSAGFLSLFWLVKDAPRDVLWFLLENPLEFSRFSEFVLAGKRRPAGRPLVLAVCDRLRHLVLPRAAGRLAGLLSIPDQADSRFLPFALRALMMARPARVDIRARKPCLRARLSRLG